MGTGISLVTLANLGTTAISSLPYVLSFVFPLSFGAFTALMNITFVLIQILLMKKEFPKEQYLQFIVGPILGLSIDLNMYLFSFLQTPAYLMQVIMLLIGCTLLAFSTVLQLEANVVNNAGEGIVKVLALKSKKKFGDVKLIVDVSIVVVAVAISFIGLGEIQGIREGTIVSALIVGPMVKLFRQVFDHGPAIILQKKDLQKE
jgi:uncharacterized membrane protein YczE